VSLRQAEFDYRTRQTFSKANSYQRLSSKTVTFVIVASLYFSRPFPLFLPISINVLIDFLTTVYIESCNKTYTTAYSAVAELQLQFPRLRYSYFGTRLSISDAVPASFWEERNGTTVPGHSSKLCQAFWLNLVREIILKMCYGQSHVGPC
jgi:hypothetical protein